MSGKSLINITKIMALIRNPVEHQMEQQTRQNSLLSMAQVVLTPIE